MLRCSQPATIARKQKVAINLHPHGKWETKVSVAVVYTHLYVRLLTTMSRQYAHYCVLILNFQRLFIIYNIT